MPKSAITNRVAELRKHGGISAADLAQRVGVSRQTIYAIEAGTYVPNTEVALHLARELQVRVDQLFALQSPAQQDLLDAEVLSAVPPAAGQAVRICRVGDNLIAVPVSASPYYLPEADGVVKKSGKATAALTLFNSEKRSGQLVIAGCDPAAGLLTATVNQKSGIELVSVPASSRRALAWLKDGKVHVAGTHLDDPNLRREFPAADYSFVAFARWEEGLVVAPGNPKKIRRISDLANRRVRFVNREPGSGARALVDRLLKKSAVSHSQVSGYDHVVQGHLAAAYAVLSGDADVCLATGSAARAFGLDFVPLHSERYDLVLRKRTLELPAAIALLDVLQQASLRSKLEVLAGYDTSQTGSILDPA